MRARGYRRAPTHWLASWALAAAPLAQADPPSPDAATTPFDRGGVALSLGVGAQRGTSQVAIGGALGYFVLDGVALGLSTSYAFGRGPSVTRVSPALTYVAHPLATVWPVVPYVGGFYKHWFIGDGYNDADSLGGRVGLYFVSGHGILGLGIGFERVVSTCSNDCNSIYPDLSLGFAL